MIINREKLKSITINNGFSFFEDKSACVQGAVLLAAGYPEGFCADGKYKYPNGFWAWEEVKGAYPEFAAEVKEIANCLMHYTLANDVAFSLPRLSPKEAHARVIEVVDRYFP